MQWVKNMSTANQYMYVNHFLLQTQSALFFIHILPSCRCHLFTCTKVEPNIIQEIEKKICIIEIQLHKIEVKTPQHRENSRLCYNKISNQQTVF